MEETEKWKENQSNIKVKINKDKRLKEMGKYCLLNIHKNINDIHNQEPIVINKIKIKRKISEYFCSRLLKRHEP